MFVKTALEGDTGADYIDILYSGGDPIYLEKILDFISLLEKYPTFWDKLNKKRIINMCKPSPYHMFLHMFEVEEFADFADSIFNIGIFGYRELRNREVRTSPLKAVDFENKDYTPVFDDEKEEYRIMEEARQQLKNLYNIFNLSLYMHMDILSNFITYAFWCLHAYEDCVKYHCIMQNEYGINLEEISRK